MSANIRGLLALGVLLVAAPASAAGELPHALELWDSAARAAIPTGLRVWLGFLLLSFLASGFFVRERIAARWVLGGFVASHLSILVIEVGDLAIVRRGLVSLLHVLCWGPAVPPLWSDARSMSASDRYGVWCRVMLAVIAIAFIFDLRDAGAYVHHLLRGHPALSG